MVLLESEKLTIGNKMPGFELRDPHGNQHSIESEMVSKGLLIMFTCNHCPYAVAVWDRFIRLASEAKELGINTVAINPNIHPAYPADSPEAMKGFIVERGIHFPYLVDDTQEVAKAYGAVCTPDIYLINENQELFYHGRIDDNWKDESQVSKRELEAAIQALAKGDKSPEIQYSSMGCSIKWLDT